MDIDVAFIKYFRQQIGLDALSYVSAKWLEENNYSSAIVSLAYEYNPFDFSQDEVDGWIKAYLEESNFKIPSKPHSDRLSKGKGPPSALSDDFENTVKQILGNFSQLIVCRRHAYVGGGGGSWHLITNLTEWAKILEEGRPKTAYTLILDNELSLVGAANGQLLNQALGIFDKWGDLIVAERFDDDTSIHCHPFRWQMTGNSHQYAEETLNQSKNKIAELFKEKEGKEIAIGRNIWEWEDDIDEITAYVPGPDGIVRTGAY